MILIVTYDLKTPRDYHEFYEALKAQADNGKWWHYMSSTWLLSTTKTPQQIVDAVTPYFERQQDFIFVCELTPNYQGWLPKQAWDWINAELRPVNHLAALAALAGSRTLTPPPGYTGLSDLASPPDPETANSLAKLFGLGSKKNP
jgi:hypothetical protein